MNIFRFAGWDLLFGHISGGVILLLGALVVGAMIFYYLKIMPRRLSSVRYSDLTLVDDGRKTVRQRLRPLVFWLRVLAVALFFVALARPQAGNNQREIETEGIDIMLALDISGTMQTEDFQPENRLYVAKEEINKFIDKRANDRIGLVVFAKSSFTQCPLTLDYGVLKSFLAQVEYGLIEDGTAIGSALANCTNRLLDSDAKSKIIILLTDGLNNAGEIDPLTAANIAKTMGIRIYTIGVGRPGNAIYPIDDPVFGKRYVYLHNEIDEVTLGKIAETTGGKYYRARTEDELDRIYTEIDRLEKTKMKIHEYTQYRELFAGWLLAGFALLLLEMVLGQTYLRKIP